jgi:hypothetical protein
MWPSWSYPCLQGDWYKRQWGTIEKYALLRPRVLDGSTRKIYTPSSWHRSVESSIRGGEHTSCWIQLNVVSNLIRSLHLIGSPKLQCPRITIYHNVGKSHRRAPRYLFNAIDVQNEAEYFMFHDFADATWSSFCCGTRIKIVYKALYFRSFWILSWAWQKTTTRISSFKEHHSPFHPGVSCHSARPVFCLIWKCIHCLPTRLATGLVQINKYQLRNWNP